MINYVPSVPMKVRHLPVPRKYSVLAEIIDILTQTCQPFMHDEEIIETDFEPTFQVVRKKYILNICVIALPLSSINIVKKH